MLYSTFHIAKTSTRRKSTQIANLLVSHAHAQPWCFHKNSSLLGCAVALLTQRLPVACYSFHPV